MNFFVIASKQEEEVFYDTVEKNDTFDLSSHCLFPAKSIAEDYIEDHLSVNYMVLPIELTSASRSGELVWSRDKVQEWGE